MVDIKDDPDKLLKLYEIARIEEQYFLKEHQSRIAFFTSIISVLIGATLYGITQVTEWYHPIALLVAPIMIYAISNLAIRGSFRFYQRFVEAVMIKAKIDQRLELTRKDWTNINLPITYWQNEPLIPERYINARSKSSSSADFYNEVAHGGYHKYAKWLFYTFQVLSIALLIGLLLLTNLLYDEVNFPYSITVVLSVICIIIPICANMVHWFQNKKVSA